MNKLFYIALTFLFVTFLSGCDPITDIQGVGTVITSADQLQVTITPVMDNALKTNKVKVHCTSPVLCQWTDGVKKYNSNDTVMTLFITGSITIKLNAMAADGTILTKDFVTTVDEMKFPVEPQYGYFCGTGVKTWTWADSGSFGNGGATDVKPAWWILSPADITGQCTGKSLPAEGAGATLKFTLNGLMLDKITADGTVTSGVFSFDMKNIKTVGWSIGKLTLTNTNILFGYDINAAGNPPFSVYDIIALDANKMILSALGKDGTNWYWVFKAK